MSIKTIEDSSLTAIAEAIRDKNGETTTYTPAEMAPAIEALDTSGGGEDTSWMQTEFSGDLSYFNYGGNFTFYLEQIKDKLSIVDVTNLQYFCGNDQYLEISDIYGDGSSSVSAGYFYYNNITPATTRQSPPTLHNINLLNPIYFLYYSNFIDASNIFDNCTNAATSNGVSGRFFSNCYYLRHLPSDLYPLHNPYVTTVSYATYYQLCAYDYSLDEILNIPVEVNTAKTSQMFTNFAQFNYHLKRLTFSTNDDGTAKTTDWSNQSINLSSSTIGYFNTAATGLTYFTSDTQITDAESYEALKDNPDAWTALAAYSRYDHDSAVETINSLPDVTSGSSNVITFLGESGSATDAGAINTLTDEEIAVGTDKGWTISIT